MRTLYLSDLDGTLLRSDLTLSEYTCSVISKAVSMGVPFAFATARSRTTALKVTAGLEVPLPIIAYNGVFIVDTKSGDILSKQTFTPDEAREIYGCMVSFGLSPIVYRLVNGREKFSYYPGRVSRQTMDFIESRGEDPRKDPLSHGDDILSGEPFYFNCIAEEPALRGAYRQLKDRFEVKLRDMLGCGRIAAFGDSVNDIPLFETADERYAVANADERLKRLADEVIASNDSDGVAKKLEQMICRLGRL